jgi:multiple antibiotic resistance protein
MVSFLEVALLAFTTLFPVANPLGMAPVFLALTQKYPLPAKKILARKIAAYSFALLAGSLFLGTRILEFFGISLAVIQIAGGASGGGYGLELTQQNGR